MPPLSLEDRVAALEKQVAAIQADKENGAAKKDWRRTVGMFTNDPGMLEIFDEALKIREADRAKARRRARKPKRAKS